MKPELLVHRGYFYTPYIIIWNAGLMGFAHIKYATTSSIEMQTDYFGLIFWLSRFRHRSISDDFRWKCGCEWTLTPWVFVFVYSLKKTSVWVSADWRWNRKHIKHQPFSFLKIKNEAAERKVFCNPQTSKTPSTHFQKDEDTFLITSCEVSSLQKCYSC